MKRFFHGGWFLLLMLAGNGWSAEWIWTPGEGDPSSVVELEREIVVDRPVVEGHLAVLADFAHVDVWINETRVARLEAYDPAIQVALRGAPLRQGRNRIVLRAVGVDGPSALAARLVADLEDGGALMVSTDGSWRVGGSEEPVRLLGQVAAGALHAGSLPAIKATDEYNQWREALGKEGEEAGARFTDLPEGFELEELHRASGREGSWVSLAFDSEGRLFVGKESEGILRFVFSSEGEVVSVEEVEGSLDECRGLLWAHDRLYANANESKALYRLHDGDGDGRFEERERLQSTGGKVGHGRNDLALGPDGKLYIIHGDSVEVPETVRWITPREPERAPPMGHLVRTGADGTPWEVISRGLRNPYGVAFNRDGEAFTYDADNEGDIGLPLYRPTRINHLVSGANYGWRQAPDGWSWPVYQVDSVPSTFDVGRGSPTSVMFATDSAFPSPWKERLFALDWAYGRVLAIDLEPNGASYRGSGTVFLRGRPLNVTDLAFGPDGALYLATGGRKTRAALYRIRFTGSASGAPSPSEQAERRRAFSAKAREDRRTLESLHPNRGNAEVAERVRDRLGSPDPWIRNAARAAFERNLGSSVALPGRPGELATYYTLVAIARVQSERGRLQLLDRALKSWQVPDSDLPGGRTQILSVARLVELCGYSAVAADADLRARTLAALDPLFPDEREPVNRELAKLLAGLGADRVIPRTLDLAASADSQTERLHYLDVLSRVPNGWTAAEQAVYLKRLAHARVFSKGDRHLASFFDHLEDNTLARLDREQRRAYGALVDEVTQPPPAPVPARPVVKAWKLSDFPDLADHNLSERSAAKGRAAYEAALCSRCHQFGSLGIPVGPDLSVVASRFGRRELLESILEPSRVIAEVHRNEQFTLKNGEVLQGRVIRDDFRGSRLWVATNPFAPAEVIELPKADVVSTQTSPVSPMPPGLLDRLDREAILDLLAFLEAGPEA